MRWYNNMDRMDIGKTISYNIGITTKGAPWLVRIAMTKEQ